MSFTMRPYQQAAYDAVLDRLYVQDEPSTLVVHATGTGKTVLVGELARHVTQDRGERMLFLAHRGLLLEQAAAKLERFGVATAIEKADQSATDTMRLMRNSYVAPVDVRCVVGSVQTLKGPRLERWAPDTFQMIVIDEAHHVLAPSYLRILAHFDKAKRLGVTATPDRLDGRNVGSVFTSVAHEYHLDQGVREGYLCPLTWFKSAVQVDLRGLAIKAGDFNEGQLEDRIGPLIETLANSVKEVIGDRPTIIFTPKVHSAKTFAGVLNDQLGVTAKALWDKAPDREATERAFRENRFQVLVNCSLYTEGADFPHVRAVVLARPTQSRGLLSQMVGRGTRLCEGKSDCLIVDFTWLCDRHRLVSPVELVVPEADGDLSAMVERLMGTGRTANLLDAREQAERILAAREAEEERRLLQAGLDSIRLGIRQRDSGLSFVQVDALDVRPSATLMGITWDESADHALHRATERQIEILTSAGVPRDEVDTLSRHAASAYLDWLSSRRAAGLATLKQVRFLTRQGGLDRAAALKLTKVEATRRLEGILGRFRAGASR